MTPSDPVAGPAVPLTRARVDYCAFVSYRHADPDRAWARWVVETLERWRTPRRLMAERGLPRRLGRAFQDEQELSAGPTLHAEIHRRLEASRFLIVICSPQSRGRPWIEQEVREFLAWGRGERVLPLLVDGEPAAALPEALLARGAPADGREPLAADVRPAPGESLRERRRRAALQLLAPILGVDLDTLRRRDDQRRRQRWALLSLALGCVVLTLAILAAWALRSSAQARERLLALHAEQGRVSWLAGAPAEALLHLAQAYEGGDDSAALRFLLARARAAPEWPIAVLASRGARVSDLAFSSDGSLLATACDDGCVRLWDARDGALVHEPAASGPTCRAIAFSPDGARLLASSGDLAIRVYRTGDGSLERTVRPPPAPDGTPAPDSGFLWHPQFLAGSQTFAVVGGCCSRLLVDLADGSVRRLPDGPGPAEARPTHAGHYEWSCAVRGDAARIATADQMGWLRVYDAQGRPVGETRRAHENTVRMLAFGPDDGLLYSIGDDGTLACWPPDGGGPRWRTQRPVDGSAGGLLALVPGGPVLGAFDRGEVRIYRRDDGGLARVLDLHRSEVTALALDPQRERLLSASLDGRVRLVELATWRTLADLEGHGRAIHAAAFSPTGARIATASADGTARLWSGERRSGGWGRQILRTGVESILLVGGSSQGSALVAAADGRVVRFGPGGALWEQHATEGHLCALAAHADGVAVGDTGGVLRRVPARAEEPAVEIAREPGPARALVFLHGERLASAGTDGVLRIHALGRPGPPEEHPASAPILCLAASQDRRRLACGASDGSVWLWEEGPGGWRRLHAQHRSHVKVLAISPSGGAVLSGGSESRAVLWDVGAGRVIAVLGEVEGGITGVALDASGRRAATAGQDGRACLWDARSGRLERVLGGRDAHRSFANVRFSADGELLLTFGGDALLRVWAAATGRLLDVLQGHDSSVNDVAFVGDGALSVGSKGEVWWWNLPYELRSARDVAAFVREQVPWRLDADGLLVPSR